MKLNSLISGLLLTVAISAASASGVDPRFDGQWAGVETYQLTTAAGRWDGPPPQSKTTLVIANSGQLLGVLGGFAPGRYEVSPKSSGNTLVFTMPNQKAGESYIGRKECRLVLSADGNKLKEEGYAVRPTRAHVIAEAQGYRTTQAVSCDVVATFQRVGGARRAAATNGNQKSPANAGSKRVAVAGH